MGDPGFTFKYKHKQTQNRQMNNNKNSQNYVESEDMEVMIIEGY